MPTLLDVMTDALSEIGQVGIGGSISPEQSQQAFRVSNRLMAKWSSQRLLIPQVSSRVINLTPGTQDYTMGPSGVFGPTRPMFVEAAVAVIPGSSEERPLDILDKVKWGAIEDKGATTSAAGVPSDVWPEYSMPNLGLHFWPVPANAAMVELATWELIQQFATLADVLTFPPEYETALQHNLAMELCNFYMIPVPEAVAALAAESLNEIKQKVAQTMGGAIGFPRTLQSPTLDLPVGAGAPPPQGGA